jgi:hypothetical protein
MFIIYIDIILLNLFFSNNFVLDPISVLSFAQFYRSLCPELLEVARVAFLTSQSSLFCCFYEVFQEHGSLLFE